MANAVVSKQFQVPTNVMTTTVPMDPENNDSDTFSDDERTGSSTAAVKKLTENDDLVKNVLKSRNEESKVLGLSRDDEEDDDNDDDDGEDELASSLLVSPDKLGPADRDLYEKLRQQEREEREEIERELREQEQGLGLHSAKPPSNVPGLTLGAGSAALPHSLALSQHAQQLRAREKEIHLAQERMLIKTERELDLSTSGGGGNLNRSSSASSSPINNSSSNGDTARGATPNDSSNKQSLNMSSSGANIAKSGNNKFNGNSSSVNRSPSANSLNGKNPSGKSTNHSGDGSTTPGSNNGDVPQHLNKINLPPTPEEFRAHLGLPGSAAAANSFLSSFPFGHPFAAAHAHLALGGHPLLGGRDIKGMMLDGTGLGGGNPLLGGGGGAPSPPIPPSSQPVPPHPPQPQRVPQPALSG